METETKRVGRENVFDWVSSPYLNHLFSVLRERAGNFWLCLFVVLLLDALANPYAGIVHDARLYALQALSHLHPGRYEKDLFFLFGSQDDFSLFSLIHAQAISLLGLKPGTFLLYLASRILLLSSFLSFFRNFSRDNFIALIVASLLAAGQLHYIIFDINEPFLTPRLAATALSLFCLSALLQGERVRSLLFLLAAGLLHPLVVLGPGAVILILWIWQKEWRLLGQLGGAVFSGLILLMLLKPEALASIDFFTPLDKEWQDIIFARSTYLFPLEWPADTWKTIAASLLLAAFSLKSLHRQQQECVVVVAFIAALGILCTFLAIYLVPWALLFQIQPWRSFWLLKIITPVLAIFWGGALWKSGEFTKRLAAVMVVVSVVLSGGASAFSLPWIVFGWLVSVLPARYDSLIGSNIQRGILCFSAALILAQPLLMVAESLPGMAGPFGVDGKVLSFVAILGPFFRILGIMAAGGFLAAGTRVPMMICIAATTLLMWKMPDPVDGYHRDLMVVERGIEEEIPLPEPVRQWKKYIPASSLIFSDGSIPVEAIWFDFDAGSYYSHTQGPGVLFDRRQAIEYTRRKHSIENVFHNILDEDLVAWCQQELVTFVVTKKNLHLEKKAEHEGMKLYSCN